MNVNLIPFSIYWFLFLILNVIYFIFPFLFFLLLPAVFVMILIWGICVFEIGRATIISSQTKRITRVMLAFLASLLTISINPIGRVFWILLIGELYTHSQTIFRKPIGLFF